MVLKRSNSSIYEDELRELLTYECAITGKKRCPPYSSNNLDFDFSAGKLGAIGSCLTGLANFYFIEILIGGSTM